MQVQCSNCGLIRNFRYSEKRISSLVQEGWGSFGHALYCPDCSATWEKRNGTDRPMASDANTAFVMRNWCTGRHH